MKTFIKNQKIMLVLLLLGAILNANSQPHLCDDPCPPGPIIWKMEFLPLRGQESYLSCFLQQK